MTSSTIRRPSKPAKAEPPRRDPMAALRAADALRLRALGLSYCEIAERVGYGGRAAAYHAVQRELQRTLQEPAEDMRRLEHEHLLKLRKIYAVKALRGDQRAAEFCLRLSDRLAKLQGLDLLSEAVAGATGIGWREYPEGVASAV